MYYNVCLFCGGNGEAPDHLATCDGRQGRREADMLDAAEGRRRRDHALAEVEAHAEDAFLDLALLAVERVARRQARFGSDDVWLELRGAADTHDRRALGAVMLAAKRQGLIVPTPEFQSTAQPKSHHSPMRIWRSLVWSASAGAL